MKRDAYADCGRAHRAVLMRAHADNELTLTDLRVLNAVLMSTVAYSKLLDVTTRRNLAALAFGVPIGEVVGWQRKRVAETLDRLAARGHLAFESIGKGSSARVRVSFPMTPKSGAIAVGNDPVIATNDPVIGVHNDPAPRGTPRSNREISTEPTENSPDVPRLCAEIRKKAFGRRLDEAIA